METVVPLTTPPATSADVLLTGTVFVDLVFTGFPTQPAPGTEVFTEGMGTSPGGIANLAVAASRLGLATSLVAAFGEDMYADWLWHTLGCREHIELTYSRRFADWHSPVTVAIALDGDRSFITHAHPSPLSPGEMVADATPTARSVFIDVGDAASREESWWRECAARGSLVFADAGWDPQERWDSAVLDSLGPCHALTPNHVGAMGYTHTDSPAAALAALADLVPLVVVTAGRDGAFAIDSSTGEQAQVSALHVDEIDATGAGDTFAAALVAGTLRGWPLEQRLSFSSLCAALAVQQFGGALAAPGWGDIADWWHGVDARASAGDPEAREARARFRFLESEIPAVTHRVRRAEATIARFSDADLDDDQTPPAVSR